MVKIYLNKHQAIPYLAMVNIWISASVGPLSATSSEEVGQLKHQVYRLVYTERQAQINESCRVESISSLCGLIFRLICILNSLINLQHVICVL